MVKKTFIPNWYLDKKELEKNKKNKVFIILISMINIVLISFVLNNSNKIKDIDQEFSNKSNNISMVENVRQDIITIEKYKELSTFFEVNNLSYKNMVITKESLEIDIEVKSYEEYIHVIKCIENHYSIKRLAPNIKNGVSFDFKVVLEV